MKKLIKKLLGVKDSDFLNDQWVKIKFHWANDEKFNALYSLACKKTQTDEFLPHKMRSYTALEYLKSAPEGEVAEVGTYRGCLAYQMRTILGKPVNLFDSFEGISGREKEDVYRPEQLGGKGDISCSLEQVRENLKEFPDMKWKLFKGWIPNEFKSFENLTFSFVYVDVDVYQPTKDSFDFFYPRLVRGGIIMCDDYGFRGWPGAKKAVDEMSIKHGFKVVSLTTGQCVIIKS